MQVFQHKLLEESYSCRDSVTSMLQHVLHSESASLVLQAACFVAASPPVRGSACLCMDWLRSAICLPVHGPICSLPACAWTNLRHACLCMDRLRSATCLPVHGPVCDFLVCAWIGYDLLASAWPACDLQASTRPAWHVKAVGSCIHNFPPFFASQMAAP